jgi:hypothetical protein
MLASGSVASTAGATVSSWGRGADSSAAGAEASSATAVLGSSPFRPASGAGPNGVSGAGTALGFAWTGKNGVQ